MTTTSTECSGHPDDDFSEFIATSKVANQKGRTMYHAFQRFCSDFAPHSTSYFNNHDADRREKKTLQNHFNRLVKKAKQKGIIWLPTQPNAV